MCACGIEIETSVHFFHRCPRYPMQRAILLIKRSDIIHNDVSALPMQRAILLIKRSDIIHNDVSALPMQRAILLIKRSDIIHNDVSVFPDEHLFHILIYGSNV